MELSTEFRALRLLIVTNIISVKRPNLSRKDSNNIVGFCCFCHRRVSGHEFDFDEVKILDRESRWFERGVKESIWVRAEQPTLNRSGEVRHNLSHAWDRAIKNSSSQVDVIEIL